MRKLGALIAVTALALAGCGAPIDEREGVVRGDAEVIVLPVPGGGELLCAVFDADSYAGGMDCNWEAFNNG